MLKDKTSFTFSLLCVCEIHTRTSLTLGRQKLHWNVVVVVVVVVGKGYLK